MGRTIHTTRFVIGAMLALALGALLTACGSASAASSAAKATPTCAPTRAAKAVSGTISATAAGSITVTDASGTATQVQIDSNTRITRIVTKTAADLTAGTNVQVVTDSAVTAAQRIVILTGTTGSGGFGGFGGRGQGTPPAGTNPACFRRGQGTPGAGFGAGNGNGTGSGFQGIRGTVDSATSTKLVFDDTQGQTFSCAITPTTIIQTSEQGQITDLIAGAKVMVIGTASGADIVARTITIQG
ncbi:MAG: hypothetical protein OJF49_003442 [Ktedonobacterales bacterium]|nr:MAG: hypothetical protein OJF49_003442 [Ktedonobacterales bacterium]